jgi:hypothetical protein
VVAGGRNRRRNYRRCVNVRAIEKIEKRQTRLTLAGEKPLGAFNPDFVILLPCLDAFTWQILHLLLRFVPAVVLHNQ